MRRFDLAEGSPVVVYLHDPKEKVWGLLVALHSAGVVVRGLDIETFEDWMRQEARRADVEIGPMTLFYPLNRVERLERDETVGPIESYADRFAREVGRTVRQVVGLDPVEG